MSIEQSVKNSLSFLTSYFIIILIITELPPPSDNLCLSRRTSPTIPISPSELLFFCISAHLQLKEEDDLHMEERGVTMMGLSIGGREGDITTMMMMERGGMVT